jgi:2-phosphoglycerate kinase
VGVPVIENTRVERTAEAVIRLVLEQVERAVGAPTISA